MRKILLTILLSSVLAPSFARNGKTDVKFDYAVSLEYLFENQEYYKSNELFIPSMTLHAVRLTPEAGVYIRQNKNIVHRVRLGVDIIKHTGENLPIGKNFQELSLYYNIQARLGNGSFLEAFAGSFGRSNYEGDFNGPLYNIQNLFLDNNIEGMLFKYKARRFYAELGLDWMGMFADKDYPDRRERFQILSSGDWRFAGDFHLKWLGSFYHFACSLTQQNVIDNHTIIPMVEWRTNSILDQTYVNVGGVFSYQCDRELPGSKTTPMGFISRQGVSKWKIHLDNMFYWGDDLQPFYGSYGSELYFGEGIFHTQCEGQSVVDRLVLSYQPKIAKWLDLTVAAIFDFGSPIPALNVPAYRGCQQVVKLRFNIERF